MAVTIKLDKEGRVFLPKRLREALGIEAGDTLQMDISDETITLRPQRAQGALIQEKGVWIYPASKVASEDSLPELLDRVREERLQDFT